MDLIRPFTSGFWKFTVPATLRQGWGDFIDRIPNLIQAEKLHLTGLASTSLALQLRRALWLASQELMSCAQRFGAVILPAKARFPVALLAYLLLVFALEAFFLKTFLPGDVIIKPRAMASGLMTTWDPDEIADARELILAVMPSAFVAHISIQDVTGSITNKFSDPDSMSLLEDTPETSILFRHQLLTLNLAPGPQAPIVPYDSVRLSVDHSTQRMPVDPEAVHPLDRAAFQATATRKTRLSGLFARIKNPRSNLSLASLPNSAIAPPMSRLDRLRSTESRRRRLGSLCALFESGVRGIFAIGYDIKGGTSYGKYQISSRKGAMRNFITYLEKRAPSWAHRLRTAGRSNTGGTSGTMPRTWKNIASEHPKLFEKLQDDFIHNYYYSPTLNEVKMRAGLDLDAHPPVVREVLWSTAVQHGPSGGASIFITANSRAKGHTGKDYVVTLLKEVFRERGKRLSKIPLRTRTVLQARLKHEMSLALNRLGDAPERRAFLLSKGNDRLM